MILLKSLGIENCVYTYTGSRVLFSVSDHYDGV